MSYEGRSQHRSRNDGRRYGGYNRDYRGGNRYRDDYRKRHYRQPSPSRDEVEDIEERLKGLIIKIGDKITPDLQVNLNKMKNILDNDYEKYPDMVQETLQACVLELPSKTPIYGTLIGLLNASNNNIVLRLMEGFNTLLTTSVEQADWFKLKQLVRFYGELVNANVILPSAYCHLLEDILADLDQSKQLKRRLDCLVYIVLNALPWCGKELNERCGSGLEGVLNKIDTYMNSRETIHFPILKVFQDEQDQDELLHLWNLIQQLEKSNWKISLIPKVYKWFDDELNRALQHEIPRVTLPLDSDESARYIHPRHILRIFIDEDGKTKSDHPDHRGLDYFILNDIIADTIQIFEANRKECGKYLLNIAGVFEPGHFMSQMDDDDDDDDERINEKSLDWNASEILMESLLSQMLMLPISSYRLIFFSTLMAELVRLNTKTFPMALGRSVKLLFDRLDNMDTECVARLWTWFGHHLSNFGFQWDWVAWEDALTLDKLHPQVCFIRETIEKEIRLSYYERIKTSLPSEFVSLAPAEAPGPNFSFGDTSHPLNPAAKKVVEALRSKKSVEEVRELLENIKRELGDDDVAQSLAIQDLFIQCLLLVGSKSFSHVLNVVERYLEVMRHFNGTHEEKVRTVEIVATFWKNNTQFLCILLDKLLNYRIVDPASVIAWIFDPKQLENAGRSYIWEILKNTLNKVVSRAAQIKSRLETFRQQHRDNEIARAAKPSTEITQAEAQQELDAIQIAEQSFGTVSREQKEVFMVMYQRFAEILQSLLKSLEAQGRNPDEDWTFWWMNGWFKEILRLYHDECAGFKVTLESVVFTSDLEPRIINLFQQVQEWNQSLLAKTK
ncbi:armadillo-type protein [Halteromyces radiatus]|uniref:armadillo-type protein n=1 Tax=Halteromyces radiatus TaxID=101107 RepID=UPI0022209BA0|nr:armadillo-type protein [Halteromyces radiatus]KAI8083062.1 armadillo-type protein [Halteromyces radiatus]